jgi:Cu-processing system permease protein
MTVASVVLRSGLSDLARNRWVIGYAAAFFVIGEALFWFGGTGTQVVLSLLNIVLMVVPMVSLVFGAIYVYGAREFTEMLLAQPVPRRQLFVGLFLGLAIPLAGAFLVGAGLPFLLHRGGGVHPGALVALLVAGTGLGASCAAIAVAIALYTDDRLRGVGITLGVWLAMTVLYDAAILAIVASFDAWPLERPLLVMMLANPVDLARGLVLTQLDVSALMGYTGALFERTFGSLAGTIIAVTALAAWTVAPFTIAARRFRRRDF